MEIKKIISLLLIVFMLALVGCKGGEKKVEAPESPYIGGSKGLVAKFENMGIYNEKTNIEEIFEGETFPIEITLKNKGEQDILPGDVVVSLKGILLSDFSGIVANGTLTNEEKIEKVSEYNKEGGELTLDFTPEGGARYLVNLSGSHYDISVFAEVVYNYKTYAAVPKVCFKEDLQDESVCDVEEEKAVFSSGAPIQVKKATEKRAGTGKIAVEFEIENIGSGDVTKPDEDFDSRYDQLAFYPNEDIWECKSSGKINEGRFDSDGKMIVVCRLKEPMPKGTLYTKELDLTLDYKYKELIHHQLRINEQ